MNSRRVNPFFTVYLQRLFIIFISRKKGKAKKKKVEVPNGFIVKRAEGLSPKYL